MCWALAMYAMKANRRALRSLHRPFCAPTTPAAATQHTGLPKIQTIQNAYHLLARVNYETDLAETCRRHNVSLLAYSPLAGEWALLRARALWLLPDGAHAVAATPHCSHARHCNDQPASAFTGSASGV